MKLRTGGSMAWRGWASLGVAAMLAIAPVARGQEAPPNEKPVEKLANVPAQPAVAFIDAYRQSRAAYREVGLLTERGGNAALSEPENLKRVDSLCPQTPATVLLEALGADPLAAVDVLVGISPSLHSEGPLGEEWRLQHWTLRLLLRSGASDRHGVERANRGSPRTPFLNAINILDFGDWKDERLAAFREISREEIYRRVIARLPEVGQERMFGVLVVMFQFDHWLAAMTIDELAETGELPVVRPQDAKPTRARVLKAWIDASFESLRRDRVWTDDSLIGPLLPSAMGLAGDRWWIRAALAREMRIENQLSEERWPPFSEKAPKLHSPYEAAREALVHDPHPVVRYVVFPEIERNYYERSLAKYRKLSKPDSTPPQPFSPEAQRARSWTEGLEQRQRTLESRLGKPITEIPPVPTE
jgi:hypothetical protein